MDHPLPESDRSSRGRGLLRARVAIVGAGPAGTVTALRLAQHGIRDVVLLDAHDFPRHKTCGSGLSPRGIKLLKQLGIWERIAPRAYPISGMLLFTPGGKELWLGGNDQHTQAVVCLRHDMDYEILKGALAGGIEFVPNFRASEPIMIGSRWAGVRAADGREVHADYTIIANGAHSKFAIDSGPKRLIHTIMGWWRGVSFRERSIEMYFDKMIAPYYGWLFPESADRVNIGITYPDDDKSKNARALFRRFLDKYFADRLQGAEQIGGWKGHPILYTYRLGTLASPGRIVVGEAGRMTHPATGEGIYQGMKSGTYAADAMRDIFSGKASEEQAVRTYERRCARAFLPSFWAGGAFRQVIQTPVLDWMVGIGERPVVRDVLRRALAHM